MSLGTKYLIGLGCVLVLLSAAGCRTPTVGPDDMLDPRDIPIGHRFENGTRVKDANLVPVLFAYDSYSVSPAERHKLVVASEYLRSNRAMTVVLEGNCDERGSREYNMSLGERRAIAVRNYLLGLGVPNSRMQTKSYGEEMPADTRHNEQAWRKNRRVAFAVYE